MKAIIWNPHKVEMFYGKAPKDAKEMAEMEEANNSSLSSTFEVDSEDHLKCIISAIYNETDCDLRHEILE